MATNLLTPTYERLTQMTLHALAHIDPQAKADVQEVPFRGLVGICYRRSVSGSCPKPVYCDILLCT